MAKNTNRYDKEEESAGAVTSRLSDWVKKTLMTGMGAVFMTEEGIRHALGDMKLPKNVIAAAIAQTEKTKKEITSLIAKEVREFLDRMKLDELILKALKGQSIEITAVIKLNDESKEKKKSRKATRESEADE